MLEIEWLGNSLDIVRDFSDEVRRAVGGDLRLLQQGEKPVHARPLKAVGRGVWELKIGLAAGQFRVAYVIKRNDRIYVLHAFQKKTPKTPRQDVELARQRLKAI